MLENSRCYNKIEGGRVVLEDTYWCTVWLSNVKWVEQSLPHMAVWLPFMHEINSHKINLTLSRQYVCGDKLMIVNHSRLNRYSIHWSRAVRSHPLLHSGDFRTCIKKNTQIRWWLSLSEKVLAICKLEFGQLFRFSRPLPFLFSLTCMVEEVGKRGEG